MNFCDYKLVIIFCNRSFILLLCLQFICNMVNLVFWLVYLVKFMYIFMGKNIELITILFEVTLSTKTSILIDTTIEDIFFILLDGTFPILWTPCIVHMLYNSCPLRRRSWVCCQTFQFSRYLSMFIASYISSLFIFWKCIYTKYVYI